MSIPLKIGECKEYLKNNGFTVKGRYKPSEKSRSRSKKGSKSKRGKSRSSRSKRGSKRGSKSKRGKSSYVPKPLSKYKQAQLKKEYLDKGYVSVEDLENSRNKNRWYTIKGGKTVFKLLISFGSEKGILKISPTKKMMETVKSTVSDSIKYTCKEKNLKYKIKVDGKHLIVSIDDDDIDNETLVDIIGQLSNPDDDWNYIIYKGENYHPSTKFVKVL